MRILHVCQPTDGGAAVVVRSLVEAGVAAGDEVTVACPGDGYLRSWVVAAGARWLDLPLTRSPRLSDFTHAWQLREMVRSVDVVHAHSSKAGVVSRVAAFSLGGRRPRVVFTPHGWSWYAAGRAAGVCARFERLAGRVTDIIIVVSRSELRDGRAVLDPAASMELITNGVDTAAFAPFGPTASRPSGPLLVQVGRLSVQKGQDRSVRALRCLAGLQAHLRLVGTGPQRHQLEVLARDLGVKDRVEFVGSVDPRPHLRAADIVLLPSRWEGMSLAMLEAMSIGRAIIAADCGGSEALYDCGVLIGNTDDETAVRNLAGGIRELLDDDERRARLGQAARRRAETDFPFSQTLRGYQRVWQAPPAGQASWGGTHA